MATEFVMPKLGLTMEEGTISEWLVADGTPVTAGTAVLRVETDKTETDIEASEAGVLHHAGAPGQTFACGEVVGWFLADGEAPSSVVTTPTAAAASTIGQAPSVGSAGSPAVARPVEANGRVFVSPNARRLSSERSIPLASVVGSGPNGRIVSEDLASWTPSAPPAPQVGGSVSAPASTAVGSGVLATFAARQLADLLGVDLSGVAIDPLAGRVTRDAVAAHVRMLLGQPAASIQTPTSPHLGSLAAALQTPASVIPLRGMRGTIARRMHESLAGMAQLSLFVDADVDAVAADREQRKSSGAVPGYTDYVIAAVARALRDHPVVNSQITDDGVALLPAINVGMAVALDAGLIVPVIRNTLDHSLESLSAETSRLAAACRNGTVALTDLEGGTFSVSTLGMYGVDGFTPVINPPNTAIMGVGRVRDDVVVGDDGAVSTVKRMTLSLTWDHRAFDGAPAAAFARTVADLLATPTALTT